MAFYINGESYLSDPARPSEATKLIEAIAAESKLILFKRGRIKELPRGPISQ
jgi:hypothetical protein